MPVVQLAAIRKSACEYIHNVHANSTLTIPTLAALSSCTLASIRPANSGSHHPSSCCAAPGQRWAVCRGGPRWGCCRRHRRWPRCSGCRRTPHQSPHAAGQAGQAAPSAPETGWALREGRGQRVSDSGRQAPSQPPAKSSAMSRSQNVSSSDAMVGPRHPPHSTSSPHRPHSRPPPGALTCVRLPLQHGQLLCCQGPRVTASSSFWGQAGPRRVAGSQHGVHQRTPLRGARSAQSGHSSWAI